MVAQVNDTKLRVFRGDIEAEFLEAKINPLREQVNEVSSQIKILEASQEKTADLVLIVDTFRDGEHESRSIEILDSYYETRFKEKAVEELIQAKSILESMEIDARISITNEDNVELISVPASGAEALSITLTENESAYQKIAEILYGENADAFVIQSKEQLAEIIKFAEKFGIENNITPPKLEDIEIISITPQALLILETEIPLDATMPSSPEYRTESQVLTIGSELGTKQTGLELALNDDTPRELTFREKLAIAKIKHSVKEDSEALAKINSSRESLDELSRFLSAA